MKKILTLIAAGAAAQLSAQSVVETFDYSTGALGTTASSGTGVTGNWGSYSFAGAIGGSATGEIVTGSLSAPTDYSYTPANNRLSYTATGASVSSSMVELGAGAIIDFDANATHYISFLETHTADGFAFNLQSLLQLRDDSNATLLQMGAYNQQLLLGSNAAGGALSNGQDRLLVFKIETSSAGNDVISGSFFNAGSTIGGEPTTWAATSNETITGSATFMNISLGANAAGGVTHTNSVDEIRFGGTFGAVAVPEPSSYALLSGLLALGWIMIRRRK
jgi:hypothetical protein